MSRAATGSPHNQTMKQAGARWLIVDRRDVPIDRLAKEYAHMQGVAFVEGSVLAITTRFRSDSTYQRETKRSITPCSGASLTSARFNPNGVTAPSASSRRIGGDSGSGGHGAAARMPSRGPAGRRAQATTEALLARRCGRARRTTGQASAWRRRTTGRSEAAVTGCLSESVIKAHAPRVKARRAVAQPRRESGCRATEPGTVDRVSA